MILRKWEASILKACLALASGWFLNETTIVANAQDYATTELVDFKYCSSDTFGGDYGTGIAMPLRLTWSLVSRTESSMVNRITMEALEDITAPWSFAFSWFRGIDHDSVTLGRIVDQNVTHYEFGDFPDMNKGDKQTTRFLAAWSIVKVGDLPSGFYFKSVENGLPCVGRIDMQWGDIKWPYQQPKADEFLTTQPGHFEAPIIPYPNHIEHLDSKGPEIGDEVIVQVCDGCEFSFDFVAGQPGTVKMWQAGIRHRTPDVIMQWSELGPDVDYDITISGDQIVVKAMTEIGMLYGMVTLYQILQQHVPGTKSTIQSLHITDHPRFGIRGLLLDCVRHFRTIEEIKRVLDHMALLKLNVFQWHLSDDEGWRLEIDSFPELIQFAAFRGANMPIKPQHGNEPEPYGGYYTKAQVRDVLKYARKRGITVIPEISIPAHNFAAVASITALQEIDKCGDPTIANALNPGIDATYSFLRKIFKEVAELFPSHYVHIGGEELQHASYPWDRSPAARERAKKLGLSSADELYNVIIKYVHDTLREFGKTTLGYEEIRDVPGLDKNTIICTWQAPGAAEEAISNGYNVIISSAKNFYLEIAYNEAMTEPGLHWSGSIDLKDTYSYDPISKFDADTPSEGVIGYMSTLWGQKARTRDHLDYFLFPRLLAFAENSWTSTKDWPGFVGRVRAFLPLLERLGIRYRKFERGLQRTLPLQPQR